MNASPIVGIGTVLDVGSFQAKVVEISATESFDRLGNRTLTPWVTVEINGRHRETFNGHELE